jgi:hypothetical protein
MELKTAATSARNGPAPRTSRTSQVRVMSTSQAADLGIVLAEDGWAHTAQAPRETVSSVLPPQARGRLRRRPIHLPGRVP